MANTDTSVADAAQLVLEAEVSGLNRVKTIVDQAIDQLQAVADEIGLPTAYPSVARQVATGNLGMFRMQQQNVNNQLNVFNPPAPTNQTPVAPVAG